ncbi:hypothetical protein PHLGIDRAFT_124980 [Phlebiopsis gigantea 11061_1 CR5-6]|uniref:Leucine-rich repeat-containing N-terminal plant-type domain-containing protein n=1 Tax=Phlebiopsis gigantea (strain 11061_1 CR5-6) TaxID=745531 RepID=A0A0C3PUJ3_PHLG1|nr:hypothetical protein PHLGIDRAFT_124980 [Phlebiopsis gigantea 11061_1 CR5-6]
MSSSSCMTSSTRNSKEYRSRFKEHLSICIPPPDHPVLGSRFSPESPPRLPARTISSWMNASTVRSSIPVHNETGSVDIRSISSPSVASTRKSRLGRLFFDIRTLVHDKGPDVPPVPEPPMSPWAPLHVEKRNCCHDCPCHAVTKKSSRWECIKRKVLIYALLLIILYLLGNTIALDTRVFGPQNTVQVASNSTSSPSGLSANAQQCLSQFTVNAPSDPSGYPCSTCLPTLQTVPSNFTDGTTQDSQNILNVIQFCGLRSIFETSDSSGQSTLQNGNWAQDIKFCAWSGVACDGSGKVASLSLTFPGVPSSLPNELGALSGLQSLSVIGNQAIPAGSLPGSFTSWTLLNTLHLESTAITSLPDSLFSVAKSLGTLTLVKNGQMGNSLPSSITSSSLQNLITNGQSLTNPLSQLSQSTSLQGSLKLLDLSSTSISGVIPSSISSLSSLAELHLDSNSLSTPLPDSFPASLQILTLSNNTGLTGTVQGSFCSLGNLQTCDVQNTGLSASTGCGVCQFSPAVSSSSPLPSAVPVATASA